MLIDSLTTTTLLSAPQAITILLAFASSYDTVSYPAATYTTMTLNSCPSDISWGPLLFFLFMH